MIIKYTLLFLLVLYFIFGLSISALTEYSKIGSLAAVFGFIISSAVIKFSQKYFLDLFAICCVLSASWLWSSSLSIEVLGNYLTACLAAIFFVNMIFARYISLEVAIFLSILPFIFNIHAYYYDINYVEILYGVDAVSAAKRFGGYIGHPNSMVTRLMVPLVLFIVYMDYLRKNKIAILLAILAICSAFFAIYVSGSKKSILLVVPCVAVLIWRYIFIGGKNNFLLSILTSVLLVSVILFIMPQKYSIFEEAEVFKRFESFIFEADDSTIDRQDLIRTAVTLIFNSILFGYGLNEFSVISGIGYYSHNNYIELLVSCGLTGFFVYVYVIWGGVFRLVKYDNNNFKWIMLAILVLVLDFTGVSYGDRGSQLILATIVFVGAKYHIPKLVNESKFL